MKPEDDRSEGRSAESRWASNAPMKGLAQNAKSATTISATRRVAGLPTYILARLGVLALVVSLSGYLYNHKFVLGYIVAFYRFALADDYYRQSVQSRSTRAIRTSAPLADTSEIDRIDI